MTRFKFLPQHIEYIRKHFSHRKSSDIAKEIGCTISGLRGKAHTLGLHKTKEFWSSSGSGMFHKGHTIGIETRFKKGHCSQNKGKKAEEFMSPEALEKFRKNSFKKGNIPHNTKFDGVVTTRKQKDGYSYKFIRISLKKWLPLHIYVWMQHHGDVPKGYNIVFKDGNYKNCSIKNLECISNAELAERNRFTKYPYELRTSISLRNKINKKIQSYGKKQNQ